VPVVAAWPHPALVDRLVAGVVVVVLGRVVVGVDRGREVTVVLVEP
jgi:hypothetical protein